MLINTIYLLYKSNTKAAQNDAADLEKRIDSLKSKGKKRSEQESKDLKKYQNQLKDINNEVREQDIAYKKLGNSLMQYAAGYLSLKTISDGVFRSAGINSGLQVQSELIGQSTSALKAYGAAAEAAGGSSQETLGYVQGLFEQFAAMGVKLPPIEEVFETIRKSLKEVNFDPVLSEGIFQKYGTPPGLKPLLSIPDDEKYYKMIELQKELSANTEEGARIAREYHEQLSLTGAALESVFTAIGTKALPTLKDANKELQQFLTFTSKNLGLGFANILSFLLPAPLSAPLTRYFENLRSSAAGRSSSAAQDLNIEMPDDKQYITTSEDDIVLNNTTGLTPAEKAAQLPPGFVIEEKISTGESIFPKKESRSKADKELNESIKRGQSALQIANSTNLGMAGNNPIMSGGRSMSIKIGDVNVITQATDSRGIANDVSNDILSQISAAIANLDDGVSK